MGNTSTKESRGDHHGGAGAHSSLAPGEPSSGGRPESSSDRHRHRQSRFGRGELGILGLTGGSSNSREDVPYERRETRQEREARRLERERLAREKERERSLKEEHVDGGYLVTLGTYTGPEDFGKQIVRQLQIERKIAPFWRGLNDKEDNWTEYQLVCAGRGLPIPAADEQPPEEFLPKPQPAHSPNASTQNLNNLTVPMGPRTLSTGSDRSTSTANANSALASPTTANPQRSNSPFKPRAKALAAALSVGSRNNSTTDMTPREVNLPQDPFVNGQQMEVFLYKDATECPICFLYYPPYLNRTRCCDQPICSECFVQIKRADPHFPEHHGDSSDQPSPDTQPPEMLISEPANCPYCQQIEFGVTYEPPPFRRGLAYAMPPLGSQSTAMSSQSSLNSNLSPGSPPAGRRRTQSLSANAPNVITTDRVRPDWSSKLASQRAHQARRAAAATALHTAAFLIGDDSQQSRGFSFPRPGRFSRRNTGQDGASSANAGTESPGVNDGESPTGPEPGARGTSGAGGGRRNRMEELEEMMFMEAVRLSLAAEEERKRKQEKAERKDAKKREKEERKAAKKAEKHGNVYGGGSSASGSSLSLGLGRRRGNSAASNLRMEASVQNAQAARAPSPPKTDEGAATADKGKAVERGAAETESGEASTQGGSTTPPSLPIPATSRGPSHLRQMSNASSISSSLADSAAGSYSNQGYLDGNNPHASGVSLSQRSDEGDRDATEPMFNFRSLAEMVGVDIDNGESTENRERQKDGPEVEHLDDVRYESNSTNGGGSPAERHPTIPEMPEAEERGDNNHKIALPGSDLPTPELKITPETPAPVSDAETESKQLGSQVVERPPTVAQ